MPVALVDQMSSVDWTAFHVCVIYPWYAGGAERVPCEPASLISDALQVPIVILGTLSSPAGRLYVPVSPRGNRNKKDNHACAH